MFEVLIQYISGVLDTPDDQVRCVVLLFMGYPLALVLRHILHPSWTSLHVRHLFSSLSGLTLAALCYDWQVMVLVVGVAVGYIILLAAPSNVVQRWSMGWVFVFMSSGHLYRTLTDYGGWHLDITG
ncbi:Lysophospholipid acyltransferase 2 [Geodia barretti]|uniref:Lysophospholipid acyltransferase 2 n=1 Tax=Geodia barretti TaxID=519541 RepID=A0AA35THX5_GEOBA|nr:Lysophospholipid acyltransferase 2 [Geodia barretti]